MTFAKDIPGYEGRYRVDMVGNVFSYRSNRCLRPHTKGPSGHWRIRLVHDDHYVHKLVMLTFIGPKPTPKHVCRHLDGNAENNDVFNLEWSTHSQNMLDIKWHGNTKRLTGVQVRQIKEMLAIDTPQSAIARQYGVSATAIFSIKTGRSHRDV